jgi:hypothetical protein
MSKYTDSDFGFSFWYPSGWTVSPVVSQDQLPPGTIQKSLQVSEETTQGSNVSITVNEYDSQTGKTFADYDTNTDSPAGCGADNKLQYYFDFSSSIWNIQYPEGGTSCTGSWKVPAGYAAAADVSRNTMGGLHILHDMYWYRIVPLSANKFVVISRGNLVAPVADPLVDTIVSTDSSVATPVPTAQQIATIQAEQKAYAGQSVTGKICNCPMIPVCPAGTSQRETGGSPCNCPAGPCL